jgi:spore germination protein GerM
MLLCVTGCTLPPWQSESVQEDRFVTLYLPNDNADGFVTQDAATDGSAAHIVSLLVEQGALPEGCALLAFSTNGTSGTADMNAAYGQAVNQGTTGEYLRLGAVVNTLLVFFELDELTITIEGKMLETGHESYDHPLRFHENQVGE